LSVAVYLLHFDRPYHHARHYMGFTDDLGTRIALHKAPTGRSHHRLMQVIHAAGIGFVVSRIWPDGDRALERLLKRRKGAPRLCPLCRAARGGTNDRSTRRRAGREVN
jgi:hypothetical protein